MTEQSAARSVLITGGSGYIGRILVEELTADRRGLENIVSLDVREVPAAECVPGVEYRTGDVRDPDVGKIFREFGVDTVVHLASIVTPGKDSNRDFEYSVDVLGTRNILGQSERAGVQRFLVTSSGAAYGYHSDNPEWLTEEDPLRGQKSFPYAYHKRLVEEMLAERRAAHPEMDQLVLRPGTILGRGTSNQITALFEWPFILGIRGSESPFVFIWDRDVAQCLVLGIHEGRTGVFNLAGDGALPLRDIAARIDKRHIQVPAGAVRTVLRIMRPLGLSRYGPEQVDFLRYRPVLSNEKLKSEFGFTPRMTSAEVFAYYWECRKNRKG